jgi:hypothetical protein
MASKNDGLQNFKRGAFEIEVPVKLAKIKYKYDFLDPSLNCMSMADSIFLFFCQYRHRIEYTQIKGCFYPKKFNGWEEFAKETKLLMCLELDFNDYPGGYRDLMAFEKKNIPQKTE